ncbi:sodium:proton exchanger [Mycobacterium paraterrae]|uniref:sodium:proton exchanger n=1 Tax=Mycobacterium paraterrae TaxID=577492 RepID=UPI003D9CA8F4
MTAAAQDVTESHVRPGVLVRSLGIVSVVIVPALVLRVLGLELDPVVGLIAYGAAVVGASFVLAWAAEAAQVDVSGSLAVAVLAVIAVLPEYAVDLYYAYTAGHLPAYTQYAAANMTGSNRLLMGLGWPVVVLVTVLVARRSSGRKLDALELDTSNRVEIGFLMFAGVGALVIPASGQIHIAFGLALLGWFGFYLFKLSRGDVEEPELIGTAAELGALPDRARRIVVSALFVVAAGVIVTCAKPFADNLIGAGTQLGIDRFLLVQWLAPLASEAPEFIIATIFAFRGKGDDAIATLISAKVNQWTLLIGSLPVAYMIGGGGAAMHLDGRQVEEIVLTAAQTLMGVTLLLGLRFQRWAAWALLVLFLVQFPLTSTPGRLVLSAVYAAVAAVALVRYRRELPAILSAPFGGRAKRHGGHPHLEVHPQ